MKCFFTGNSLEIFEFRYISSCDSRAKGAMEWCCVSGGPMSTLESLRVGKADHMGVDKIVGVSY